MPSGENKVAVVIGASRGIGCCSAIGLAQAGADVVVAARNEPDIKSLAKEIEGMGRRSLAVQVDVKKKADIERLVQQAVEKFGRVDIVVYSSGVVYVERTLAESKDENFEETMAVNVRGAYWAMREILNRGKMLERRSGRIIVIASDSAKRGEAGLAVYDASKHAVLGLVRALAMEVGTMGITTNAVCPGFVRTKLLQDAASQLAEVYGIPREGVEEFLRSSDPLKRIATPEEVADMVVFLAVTPGGGAISGQGLCMATTTLS
jgi:NAD(P)-dependent dehydrogenase (short-subunit alcohol dehydrogenase family)